MHLGDSAIGMINPIHFQGPAPHPRDRGVAIDEPVLPEPARRPYSEQYGWEDGRAARLVDAGAAPVAVRTYSATVPYFGQSRAPAAILQPAEAPEPPMYSEEKLAEPAVEIHRYAYYPVVETEPEFDDKVNYEN